jgi:hypothetical protein
MCHPLPPHLMLPLSPPLLLSPFPISDPLPPRCRPRPLPPRRSQALPSTAVSAQLTVVPRPRASLRRRLSCPRGSFQRGGRPPWPTPSATSDHDALHDRHGSLRSALVAMGTGTTNVSGRRRLSACPVFMRGGW